MLYILFKTFQCYQNIYLFEVMYSEVLKFSWSKKWLYIKSDYMWNFKAGYFELFKKSKHKWFQNIFMSKNWKFWSPDNTVKQPVQLNHLFVTVWISTVGLLLRKSLVLPLLQLVTCKDLEWLRTDKLWGRHSSTHDLFVLLKV